MIGDDMTAADDYFSPAEDYYGEDSATLGDRIAAARNSAGLTQSGLAGRLGVGVKVISAWENDRSEPRANRLATLSGLLGVSVAWLLSGVGDGVSPPGSQSAAPVGPRELEITVFAADLEAARGFYTDLLGATLLERDAAAATFEFFGHRLRVEYSEEELAARGGAFAVRLSWGEWRSLVERLRGAGASFLNEPQIQNVGAPSEEAVFSLRDPGGAIIGVRAATEPQAESAPSTG